MRFKMMALVAAVSIALPAIAQTADSAKPAPKKEKKICRRYAVTGSIIGSRAECHTAAEWAAIDDKNAQNASDALNAARRPGMGPGSF